MRARWRGRDRRTDSTRSCQGSPEALRHVVEQQRGGAVAVGETVPPMRELGAAKEEPGAEAEMDRRRLRLAGVEMDGPRRGAIGLGPVVDEQADGDGALGAIAMRRQRRP